MKRTDGNILLVLLCIILALVLGTALWLIIEKRYNSKELILADSNTVVTDTALVNMDMTTEPDTTISDGSKYNHIVLIIDSLEISLSEYPDGNWTDFKDWREVEFADMDGDDVPELLTAYFTGGAHCCYVYDFFLPISENTYKRIFTFEGGENGVKIDKDKLRVNFFEQIGYFYTCYACYIEEELPNAELYSYFSLVYKNKQLQWDEYDSKLNENIIENLAFLKNRKLPELDDTEFDDGTRKAYAGHIITYFFNKERDVDAAKQAFREYYIGVDSTDVWSLIEGHTNSIFDMNYAGKYYLNDLQKKITGEKLNDTFGN